MCKTCENKLSFQNHKNPKLNQSVNIFLILNSRTTSSFSIDIYYFSLSSTKEEIRRGKPISLQKKLNDGPRREGKKSQIGKKLWNRYVAA